MKLRLVVILLAALTVATVLPTPSAHGQVEAWPQWWNDAWHMRIPVVVHPRTANALSPASGAVDLSGETRNHPVFVEVDFGKALLQGGWSSDLGHITSFTFDPDSVRVVRYSGHNADDRPLGEVPSQFYPARFSATQTERFDRNTSAVGTVAFIAEGDVEAPRHYYIYFDITQNGKKAPPRYDAPHASLADPHWTGRGHVFHSTSATPVGGQKTNIHVIALHDNTRVRVDQVEARFVYREGAVCERLDTPLARYERLSCSTGFETPFRVVADRPVVVALHGPGGQGAATNTIFPATDGGMVGERVVVYPFPDRPSDAPMYAVCVDAEGCGDTLRITTAEQDQSFNGQRQMSYDSSSVPVDPPMGQLGYVRLDLSPGNVHVVEADGDIVVLAGGRGAQHAPSVTGDPAGTVAPLLASHDVYLSSAREGAVRLWDVNAGKQVVPDDAQPFPALDNRWHRNVERQTEGAPRLFSTDATAPVVALSTRVGDRTVAPLGLGADLTQEVALPPGGQLVVFPQYDASRLTIQRYVNGVPEPVCCDSAMGRGDFKVISEDGSYRVRATKPVTLLMLDPDGDNAYGTFLPGRIESLATTVGAAEFWGNAVALRTAPGQDAVVDVRPGEQTVFEMAVENLGRDVDGTALNDAFDLDLRVATPEAQGNWTAEISMRRTQDLATGDSAPFTVLVQAPEDAEKGEVVDVQVTAASAGNPNLTARLTLRVVVSVFHDFELTFADGTKDQTRVANGTGAASFPILVRNRGTGEDTIRLERIARPSPAGWDVAVVDAGGAPVGEVTLQPNETRRLNLTIQPPEDPESTWLAVNVVGTSMNQVNIKREARATLVLEANLGVQLLTDARELRVPPDGHATFNLTVVNTGDATTVALRLGGHVPPGFTAQLETADGEARPDGLRVDLSANGTAADRRQFRVNVTAGPGLLGGESMEMLVRADIQSGFEGLDTERFVILKAVVATVHDVRLPGNAPQVVPGEATTFDARMVNEGNGEANFRILPASLPPGWQLSATPESLRLPLGGAGDVQLTLTPAAHAPPGPAAVALRLQFDDGGVQEVPLNVTVANLDRYDAAVSGRALTLTRGEAATYVVEVQNAGNTAEALNLTVDAPAAVDARVEPSRLNVPPGAQGTVLLTLQPARDAPFGEHSVRITGLGADGATRTILDATLQVVRADLVLDDVTLEGDLDDGAAVTFAATVENGGAATARDVLVSLYHDDRAVDNRTIERIPPGESRLAVLKWTVEGSVRDLRVVVDPADAYVEENEDNNDRAAVTGVQAFTPAPGALVALLAAALTATLRRRSAP